MTRVPSGIPCPCRCAVRPRRGEPERPIAGAPEHRRIGAKPPAPNTGHARERLVPRAPCRPAPSRRRGNVDLLDLLILTGPWGPCEGTCPADAGVVGPDDIAESHFVHGRTRAASGDGSLLIRTRPGTPS